MDTRPARAATVAVGALVLAMLATSCTTNGAAADKTGGEPDSPTRAARGAGQLSRRQGATRPPGRSLSSDRE